MIIITIILIVIMILITTQTSTMHDGELYDDWQFFDGVDEAEPLSKDLLTPPGSRRVSFLPPSQPKSERRVSKD